MTSKNDVAKFGKPLVAIVIFWVAIFGIALALLGEQFRSKWVIMLTTLLVHWVAITYLVWLANEFRSESFSSPKVKQVRWDEGILLVSGKNWLGLSVSVLIYIQEGDYERLVCAGTVTHQQANGLAHVRLSATDLGEEDATRIRRSLSECELSKILIKPGQS
nr:hypothetical protein [uncultured Hyphomonas sp.]